MSDTADTTTDDLPDELKNLAVTTKRGFDPKARLRNRGLRGATMTLYLDEEMGPKLGWAHDLKNAIGDVVSREREGVIGELDKATAELEAWLTRGRTEAEVGKSMTKAAMDKHHKELVAGIAEMEVERARLMAHMNNHALIVKMRAVPPVIVKDCRRKAKETLKITVKGIPEEMQEKFTETHTAHLMMVMFESVTDTESGGVIEETTYDDAIEYVRYLPPGQFERLDLKMGQVQYTDAISREIEGQEDFS